MNEPVRCPKCGKGIDNNGDGDCQFCGPLPANKHSLTDKRVPFSLTICPMLGSPGFYEARAHRLDSGAEGFHPVVASRVGLRLSDVGKWFEQVVAKKQIA